MVSIGRKFEIAGGLTGVVSHFYTISVPDGTPTGIYHLSPSLEMMVVFNFGAPVSFSFGEKAARDRKIERIGILGPLRRMMNYELKAGTDLLILPFIYDGFYRFLSINDPAGLQEDDMATHALRLEEIWHTLAAISSPEERVAVLTKYMLAVIAPVDPAAKPLLDHVEDIHDPAVNPVKVIAGNAAVTSRTVQLRFKKYVGYSPKELLRFLRFKQVMTYVLNQQQNKINWFDLIVQFGYHDQSHLIRDFKYFTGVTPRQFVRLHKEGNFCIGRD